jgi:hypothetical protein
LPFPGMDPYIEACSLWRDFHARLISRIIDALEQVLPTKYRVRAEQREIIELIEEEGKRDRSIYPDVGVTGLEATPLRRLSASGPTLTPARHATFARAPSAPAEGPEKIHLRLQGSANLEQSHR